MDGLAKLEFANRVRRGVRSDIPMFVEHMEPRILLTEIIQFSVTGGGTVTEDTTDADGNNVAFTILFSLR